MRLLERWRGASITVRLTCLMSLLGCIALNGVGMSLYDATRTALSKRADLQLVARVEHMRTLLRDLYTVQQIEARPALFETMMGNEQDIIVIRRPNMPPFIDVNPQHTAIPPLPIVPPSEAIGLHALQDGERPDGLRMRWVAASAVIGTQGETIQIIAAHVMTSEERILAMYRKRVIWTMWIAVALTALLTGWLLRRSLAPLRQMTERAADITPDNLSVRLTVDDAPAELRVFAASFNAMLDRIAGGYQRLVQFSADLAHELRTPVGVLIGQTQVILVHPRTANEYRQVLESNLEELERLARIAENILFLSQTDHQTDPAARQLADAERAWVLLPELLETVADYFEGLADERGLRFDIAASGSVLAHPLMCRRALSNLVVNAVRYATPNSVIELRAEATGAGDDGAGGNVHGGSRGARIVVSNHGQPIAQDELPRLFDRFYRRDPSRSAFTESSGLGLPIVRAIMQLHGGSAHMRCSPEGDIAVTLDFGPSAVQREAYPNDD